MLVLIFVEVSGGERPNAEGLVGRDAAGQSRGPGEAEGGGLPGVVGDLKIRLVAAEDQAEAARLVDDVLQVTEAVELLREVVNRVILAVGAFDADAVFEEVAGEVIAEPAGGALEFARGTVGVVAAAVDADLVALVERAALGVHVHDAGGAEAVLRGERAGQDLEAVHEAGVEFLAEAGDALGQQHVVDAVLEVGVLAADVELAVGVLGEAGRAQEGLVERGVRALGLIGDLVFGEAVGRRARLGTMSLRFSSSELSTVIGSASTLVSSRPVGAPPLVEGAVTAPRSWAERGETKPSERLTRKSAKTRCGGW